MVATLAGKAVNTGKAENAGKAEKAGKARNPYHFQGLFQYGWNLIPYLPPYPFHVALLVESFAGRKFRDFANFSSIAKINTREIVLSSSFAKYQSKNSKIWHENKKISSKFPSFAKVCTRET